MDIYISYTILYLLLSLAHDGHAASWSNVTDEVEKVTRIYQGKIDVIPLQNLSETLNVSLGLQLLAINNFEDAKGILDVNAYLSMAWREEIYFNAHGSAAPDTSVVISAASIWTPSLILVNSAGDGTKIKQEQSQVRIHLKSGECERTENIVFKTKCNVNFYLYPFDIHDCSVTLTTQAYTSSELILIVSNFSKDYFEKSASWSVKRMSVETLYQDSKSYVKFKITIGRKSRNYVMNYFVPIVILSFLNVFVFVVPRNSGERIGYSITCFLALVVFMNTIVTSLSRGSVFVYYMTGVMVTSAVIIVVICLTEIIHKRVETEDKKDRLCICCCASNSVEDMRTQNQLHQNMRIQSQIYQNIPIQNQLHQDSNNDEEHVQPPSCLQNFTFIVRFIFCMLPKESTELRWIHVANALDLFFFALFFVLEFVYSVVYLSVMYQRYSAEIGSQI